MTFNEIVILRNKILSVDEYCIKKCKLCSRNVIN